MATPLDRAGAALLPLAGLAALSGQRCRDDVNVIVDGKQCWVTWPPGESPVWQALLAVTGVTFFEWRGDHWHAIDKRLPRFDVPLPGEPQRLDALLFPAPVNAEPPPRGAMIPMRLRVVPGGTPRPATALRASLIDLIPWIESALTAEIQACHGAISDGQILVRGPKLPMLIKAERFWGERVLVPLGWRPDPDLPETALRSAADVTLDELLLLTESGAEAIPETALQPLTRAALRSACRPLVPRDP